MARNKINFDVEVDRDGLDKAVAEIESAFPKVIFNGNIENVYVNYTQNNFKEEIGNVPSCPDSV